MTAALITGLSGQTLTSDERAFYRDVKPAGVILFRRNVEDGSLVRPLVDSVLDAIGGDDVLVLIDQEGGRVQRLKPPNARDLPPASAYAALYGQDMESAKAAAYCVAQLVANELRGYGINTNCAPVLDLPVAGAHDIIGDRAYGSTPHQIIDLAREVCDGLMAGGVVPVIKHIPGHGRATADSHLDLPVVATPYSELSRTDFVPFHALSTMPAAMTAHVVFSDIDADLPASTSERVTRQIIRGDIGFDGLLMSDDLSMKALTGPMRGRAEAVIAAGSDLALHCNGDIQEMRAAAEGVPQLMGAALARFARAFAVTRKREDFDVDVAVGHLASLMAQKPVVA
ncbi:MAG TPA: beta-N-acetylhexosaminidase [Hyphomicrobium sp.]|nr:beta-N-acetylhexosaminidase [Hyphomicrobium sp.]